MKKIMVMILVIVMAASLLVGCSKDASANGGNNEAPSGNVSTETPEPPKKPEEPAYKPAEDFIITLDNGLEVLKIHDFMLANGFKLDESEIIGTYGDGIIEVCNVYKNNNTLVNITIYTDGQSACVLNPEKTGNAIWIRVFVAYQDKELAWGMWRRANNINGGYILPGMLDLSTADFSDGDGFYFLAGQSDGLISAVLASVEDREACPFEAIGLDYESEAYLDGVFGYVNFYEMLESGRWKIVKEVAIKDQM